MLSCKICLNGIKSVSLLSFKSNSWDVPGLLFCRCFSFFVGILIGYLGGGGACSNWNKKQDDGAFVIISNEFHHL